MMAVEKRRIGMLIRLVPRFTHGWATFVHFVKAGKEAVGRATEGGGLINGDSWSRPEVV